MTDPNHLPDDEAFDFLDSKVIELAEGNPEILRYVQQSAGLAPLPEPKTVEEVARDLGTSPRRVQQIQAAALAKLALRPEVRDLALQFFRKSQS